MANHFFERDDFTRDGYILFGKYAGKHVSGLPERYVQALIAHYKFNVAVLNKHRTRPTQGDETPAIEVTTSGN